jgi:UDP-N-acetyl-D-glucosamine dehydrogenase
MQDALQIHENVAAYQTALISLKTRQATIGVIGLGYVGLPLAQLFCKAGFPVVGFDCDVQKIARLNAGESYIKHIDGARIAELVESRRFQATSASARLAETQAIVICVPTPLNSHKEPDMSYVVDAARGIRDHLQPGQLIVLESTSYPGTLREVVKPILEETGLVAGEDFFLAFSPEREDPGNPMHSAGYIPKVVGGLEPRSHNLAVALYTPIVPKVVSVSGPEVAEACKILENTYRCVNIALVNELKMLFERMGIDIWEVIRAASTKPFGYQAFFPGPGLGGHCIPIDPFYLSWLARRYDFNTRFIELAGEINSRMPEFVVHRLLLALNSQGKSVQGSKIGVLGVAYKKDVDDPRESPSLELLKRLHALGAEVSYNDPHIPQVHATRHFPLELESREATPQYLRSQDCVLIATDHSAYDWRMVAKHSQLIVDTRNAIKDRSAMENKVWPA